jgi:hypothetical protein
MASPNGSNTTVTDKSRLTLQWSVLVLLIGLIISATMAYAQLKSDIAMRPTLETARMVFVANDQYANDQRMVDRRLTSIEDKIDRLLTYTVNTRQSVNEMKGN